MKSVENVACILGKDLNKLIYATEKFCTYAEGSRKWTDYILLKFSKDAEMIQASSCNGSCLSYQVYLGSHPYDFVEKDLTAVIRPKMRFPDHELVVIQHALDEEDEGYLNFVFEGSTLSVHQPIHIMKSFPDIDNMVSNAVDDENSLEILVDPRYLSKAVSSQKKRCKSRTYPTLTVRVPKKRTSPIMVIDKDQRSFVLVMPRVSRSDKQ